MRLGRFRRRKEFQRIIYWPSFLYLVYKGLPIMMKNGILPTVSTLIPKPLRSILKHKRERTLQNINDMYLTLKQYILSALNLFAELQSVFFLSCTRLINTQRERLDWRGPFLIFFVNSYRCFGLKRLHKISKSRRCAYIIEIKTVYE